MANTYDVGDVVRCTGTFTDSDGNAQDPTAVLFAFTTPAGVLTTYTYGVDAELIKSATGVYYADLAITESRTWRYRLYATGTGQSAGSSWFNVREQVVA